MGHTFHFYLAYLSILVNLRSVGSERNNSKRPVSQYGFVKAQPLKHLLFMSWSTANRKFSQNQTK